jgi:hypothetical protein
MLVFLHAIRLAFFIFGGFVLFGRNEVCLEGEGFADDWALRNLGEDVFKNDVNPQIPADLLLESSGNSVVEFVCKLELGFFGVGLAGHIFRNESIGSESVPSEFVVLA